MGERTLAAHSAPGGMTSGRDRRWRIALVLLSLAAACAYFVFQRRAFLNFRFFAVDYGMYDNTIWNVAHGNGFFTSAKMKSYLSVHFSPVLALLAPLYRLWDSSLWPMIVQCASLGAGSLLLAACAGRLGAPAPAAFLLSAIYCFELLAQRVHLAEFHTVALQAPFVFAFTLASLGRRNALSLLWAALLLSTREDAFVGLVPLALFLAWHQRRWFPAAVGALSLAWGLVTLLVLFPHFSGESIFERRKGGFSVFDDPGLLLAPRRFAGAAQLLPHALPALFAGAWLLVCAAPLLQIFLSGFHKQYLLEEHYAATVRPYLYLAMAAGAGRLAAGGRRLLLPAVLAASTAAALVLALRHGPMPPLPRAHPAYGSVYPRYRSLYRLRDSVDPAADVAAPDHLYPHLAHRPRIRRYGGEHLAPPPQYYLLDGSTGRGRLMPDGLGRFSRELGYSLAAVDGRFALLRRDGAGTVRYEDFRDLFYLLELETAPRRIGHEIADAGASSGMARRARNGGGSPEFASFGRPWPLGAGEYLCRLRARNPGGEGGGAGTFEAFDFEGLTVIEALPLALGPGGGWEEVTLALTLDEPARVEFRVAVAPGSALDVDRIVVDGAGLREEYRRLFGPGPEARESFSPGRQAGTIPAVAAAAAGRRQGAP